MKKFLSIIICISLVITSSLVIAYADKPDAGNKSKVPPVIKMGRTLIPVKSIGKSLNTDVSWDPNNNTVTFVKNEKTIEISYNKDELCILFNGEEVNGSDYMQINGNRRVNLNKLIRTILNEALSDSSDQDDEEEDNTGEETGNQNDDTDQVPDNIVTFVNDSTTGSGYNEFSYTGSWNFVINSGYYENDSHWSESVDSAYSIKFKGTQVKIYGTKGPGNGFAAISIDDGNEKTVDYYSESNQNNQLIYTSPILTNDEHIITIRVTGLRNSHSEGYFINADKAEIITPSDVLIHGTATASSCYSDIFDAERAVDGNLQTRWSSGFSNDEWIYVDLGSPKTVRKVKLYWESAYAREYKIQTSNNAAVWQDVYNVDNGNGGIDEINIASVNARFIRMSGMERATPYGYSLWEFEVLGDDR